MIDTALLCLRNYLNNQLNIRFAVGAPGVEVGTVPKDPDTNTSDTIIVSLINVEEERVLKSIPTYQSLDSTTYGLKNPEMRLNLYVLFSAQFKPSSYSNALKFISTTIGIFQGKNVFEDTDFSPSETAAGLEKLILELQSVTFDQNNQLWQTLTSRLVPFVLYKVRMVVIVDTLAPNVTTTKDVRSITIDTMRM